MKILLLWLCALSAIGQTSVLQYHLPDPARFASEINGKKTALYILRTTRTQVAITNYGARIVGLLVPDNTNRLADVVLGFNTIADYQQPGADYFGPIVGRYGNRIANGRFVLNNSAFQTERNNNGHTLHGGPTGFHAQVWTAIQPDDHTLRLTYVSPDGEGGFPGTLTSVVTYSLIGSTLQIKYALTTDKPTVVNPTSHAFFNLNGEGSGTINHHVLMIDADQYSAVDSGLIPQGEPVSVANTPFDFRQPAQIGERVNEKHPQLVFGGGYDHNWVLTPKPGLRRAATLQADLSGVRMEIFTDQPGLQVYGGNFFAGKEVGKYGKATQFREGMALETQHYPDSPNHPTYPNTVLKPGQTYTQTTEYRFSVRPLTR